MSVVYGPSNCGKSFWCLYLAACVAMGLPFFGREVEKGAVIYFGLEGSVGIRNRIMAMKRERVLSEDAPLHLCFSPLSLLDGEHASRVADTVARIEQGEKYKVKLIVIDTYARAMAGGDENAGKDTSAVIATVDAIRSTCKAHVMLIHHCGKDLARGARGHSSLRAATDTEIEISRTEESNVSVATVMKQRDLPIDRAIAFTLVPVHLGTDRRNQPITSCVVRHLKDDDAPARKKGRPPATSDRELLKLLPMKSTTEWLNTAMEELGVGRSAFYAALGRIRASDMAVSAGKVGWEAKIQFPDSILNHEALL